VIAASNHPRVRQVRERLHQRSHFLAHLSSPKNRQ
jgi:hypothetical protein